MNNVERSLKCRELETSGKFYSRIIVVEFIVIALRTRKVVLHNLLRVHFFCDCRFCFAIFMKPFLTIIFDCCVI